METQKCSLCRKEMNCSEEGCAIVKHLCFECYQQHEEISDAELDKMHVEAPSAEARQKMVDSMVEEVFPSVWDERKEELKELSKKELAKFMFSLGAQVMSESLMDEEEGDEEEDDGEEDN
ncbi:hypothetical protein HZC30_07805 [Candidatus Woesearchaeota archaeon]|nr:hypothetical protein [Candidatus Woesearchaeota archaeon]